jgi:preprotein translocase subunit YajC
MSNTLSFLEVFGIAFFVSCILIVFVNCCIESHQHRKFEKLRKAAPKVKIGDKVTTSDGKRGVVTGFSVCNFEIMLVFVLVGDQTLIYPLENVASVAREGD